VREETEYGNGGRDRKITRYYDAAGKLKEAEQQFKNNRPTGTWREYYADGKTPRKTETYGPTGRLNGERLAYFENGQVQTRQPYVNGFLSGLGQEYYASGKLRKEANYAHNLLVGAFRELREDGTLAVTGLYKNGKQSGEWTYYKEDGQTVDRTVTYRDGRPVPVGNPKPKPRLAPKKK
jgi:antitoxin component YwqK of YwqJK toxin-antitoxin module